MAVGAIGWQTEKRGDVTVIAPSGRIDESTASEFKDHLRETAILADGTMVIDLHGIDYMSSRGLRALTLAQRAGADAGTTIILARPNDTMREILAISRYDMIFKVVDTIEDAVTE